MIVKAVAFIFYFNHFPQLKLTSVLQDKVKGDVFLSSQRGLPALPVINSSSVKPSILVKVLIHITVVLLKACWLEALRNSNQGLPHGPERYGKINILFTAGLEYKILFEKSYFWESYLFDP